MMLASMVTFVIDGDDGCGHVHTMHVVVILMRMLMQVMDMSC